MKKINYLGIDYIIYDNKQEALDNGVPLLSLRWLPRIFESLRGIGVLGSIKQAIMADIKVGAYIWTKEFVAPIISVKTSANFFCVELPNTGLVRISKDGLVPMASKKIKPNPKQLKHFQDYNFVAGFAMHGDLGKAYRDAYGFIDTVKSKKKSFPNYLNSLGTNFYGRRQGGSSA